MVIPASLKDRFGNLTWYAERLKPSRIEQHTINGHTVKVLYEEPRKGFTYGCSPGDAVHLLAQVESDHLEALSLILFRQPTRKQVRIRPVWGRMIYFAEIGSHYGAAVCLEAQEVGAKLKWPKKLSLQDVDEVQRLLGDGHSMEETKREYIFTLSEASIRNTLLYRTLLHELGHWVEYSQDFLDDATALSEDPDIAYDLYFAKPTSEREAFAHRYATETAEILRLNGVIPFDPIS